MKLFSREAVYLQIDSLLCEVFQNAPAIFDPDRITRHPIDGRHPTVRRLANQCKLAEGRLGELKGRDVPLNCRLLAQRVKIGRAKDTIRRLQSMITGVVGTPQILLYTSNI